MKNRFSLSGYKCPQLSNIFGMDSIEVCVVNKKQKTWHNKILIQAKQKFSSSPVVHGDLEKFGPRQHSNAATKLWQQHAGLKALRI